MARLFGRTLECWVLGDVGSRLKPLLQEDSPLATYDARVAIYASPRMSQLSTLFSGKGGTGTKGL